MRKIERVIESCHECRWMLRLEEMGSNTLFAAVCRHGIETREDEKKSFLVCSGSSRDIFSNPIEIPSICPLSDLDAPTHH